MNPKPRPTLSAMPRPARILLAGDYSAVRQDLRQLIELAESGCEVCEASFGDETVRLAQQTQPDLAILDLEAGRRGEAGRIVRLLKSGSPAPRVYVLTVRDDPQDRGTGADEIFVKGRDTQRLLDAVHNFLNQPRFSR